MKTIKLFISLPMGGRTVEEISKDIEEAEESYRNWYKYRFGEDVQVVMVNKLESGLGPLTSLARSIETMADADVLLFWKGWAGAKGCQVEASVAFVYHDVLNYIPVMTYKEIENNPRAMEGLDHANSENIVHEAQRDSGELRDHKG